MPVKLMVTKADGTDAPDEYLFDRLPVTIGRAGTSHLTLPDYKRVVSKEHAQLSESSGSIYLTDLGSKNFTYLNGHRLEPNQAYPIADGDAVQIGDFTIRFIELAPQETDLSRTILEDAPYASMGNPFDHNLRRLSEVLHTIRDDYDRAPVHLRMDALRTSLRKTFGNHSEHEADGLIAEVLAPLTTMLEMRPARAPVAPSPPVIDVANGRVVRLLNALLDAAARLTGIPWHFRREFAGQAVVQPLDTAFLYDNTGEGLRVGLLDPSLDAASFEQRVQLLRSALDDLAAHQAALLEGYMAAVTQGSVHLLDTLDPALHAEEVEKGRLAKVFSARLKADVFDRLDQFVRALKAEDSAMREQRVFRPAFIRAYLSRLASSRS